MLKNTLVQLLGLVGSGPFNIAQCMDYNGTNIEVHLVAIVSLLFIVSQSVATRPTVFIEEQKILGRFLRLTPPIFAGTLGQDIF